MQRSSFVVLFILVANVCLVESQLVITQHATLDEAKNIIVKAHPLRLLQSEGFPSTQSLHDVWQKLFYWIRKVVNGEKKHTQPSFKGVSPSRNHAMESHSSRMLKSEYMPGKKCRKRVRKFFETIGEWIEKLLIMLRVKKKYEA